MALARPDPRRLLPQREGPARGAAGREPDRGVDRRRIDLEPPFQPLVERVEGIAGDLRRGGWARDRDAIAARHDRDPELALDAPEVLVVLAEQHRQQEIVVELDV